MLVSFVYFIASLSFSPHEAKATPKAIVPLVKNDWLN